MNSVTTSSVISELTRVLLDANIIAKPVTRTLLVVGGMPSGFRAFWSRAAEREAQVHMRARALPPSSVRERFDVLLGPTGTGAERFGGTEGADRQILADAAAAGARFLVTEDVDDYGLDDLASVGISAVNPDLFLAARLTREQIVALTAFGALMVATNVFNNALDVPLDDYLEPFRRGEARHG